jgi:hypothetical protein
MLALPRRASRPDAAAVKAAADGARIAQISGLILGPSLKEDAATESRISGALKLRVENEERNTDASDMDVGMRLAPTTMARAAIPARRTLMGISAPFTQEAQRGGCRLSAALREQARRPYQSLNLKCKLATERTFGVFGRPDPTV